MNLFWRTPRDFRLATTVASHGFFALAPNAWDPDRRELATTVLTPGTPIHLRVTIAQRGGRAGLRVQVPARSALNPSERHAVRRAVGRMLWLNESLEDFHALCATEPDLKPAIGLGFGRLLRGATLFEDLVKTICTCNVTWRQTVSMIRRMTDAYGEAAANAADQRAFPTPAALASVSAEDLRRRCGLGYRADWVLELAGQVQAGNIDLCGLEDPELSGDEVHRRLREIRGVGDYAASHVAILLGRFDRLAVDTELLAHYRRRFPRRQANPARIRKHYARFGRHAALVYWWELWRHYADHQGYPESWTAQ